MGATIYAATDDAPFAVPASTTLHYVVTVTSTAQTLNAVTDITTTVAHVVPSYVGNDAVTRYYPKAIYLCAMNTAHDVWVTWDGASPVVGTTQPIGVKVPYTYASLRLPIPAAIKNATIKLRSDQVGGTPVSITYEF